MSRVAILGAGSGGLAVTAGLILDGHDVALWNRNSARIDALQAAGGLEYTGVLGAGTVRPALLSSRLEETLDGAEVVIVCLPALVHERVFTDLARFGCALPVVLNPGHTGGALHLRAVFVRAGRPPPPVVEFSTLTCVARADGASVLVSGRARHVAAGVLPGGAEAWQWAKELFPVATPVPDVLASSLSNVNLTLHPAVALLSAVWIEATAGAFRFYVDGMTPGAVRVLEHLDNERRAVAAAWGHDLPCLTDEMAAIGTIDTQHADGDTRTAISDSDANRHIAAPDSLAHRYFREDFAFGLVPMLAFAGLVEVVCPLTESLLGVARVLLGADAFVGELDLPRLGLAGCDRRAVRRLVGQVS